MPAPGAAGTPHELVLEGYGARFALSAPDADTLARVRAGLPPGWEPRPSDRRAEPAPWRFAVSHGDDSGFVVREETTFKDSGGTDPRPEWPTPSFAMGCQSLEAAIRVICTRVRRDVGYHSRDRVFVHAGVVAHRGRAIVIPGHSFTGKSTLVAALVRAGAVYYSDEYAVFHQDGLVGPYQDPLSLRDGDGQPTRAVTVESLGATTGGVPVPVRLLAITRYETGSEWKPQQRSKGEGLVALMEHAVAARNRPAATLESLRRALRDALVLESARGEAELTATALLEASGALENG